VFFFTAVNPAGQWVRLTRGGGFPIEPMLAAPIDTLPQPRTLSQAAGTSRSSRPPSDRVRRATVARVEPAAAPISPMPFPISLEPRRASYGGDGGRWRLVIWFDGRSDFSSLQRRLANRRTADSIARRNVRTDVDAHAGRPRPPGAASARRLAHHWTAGGPMATPGAEQLPAAGAAGGVVAPRAVRRRQAQTIAPRGETSTLATPRE
jgi:hypothetical protein